jgi:hypothetical protein
MSDFAPGIASMRAAGIPVTRAPYADGAAGIAQSLDAMALKIREGRIDAAIIGWTAEVLKAAGLDGRSRTTTPAAQAKALLDALRESVIYAPDPYGVEMIQSAAATLCLRPGLCLNRGDCDDLTVALGSATLSLGIPTQIVKQNFGAGTQEHVLLAVYDGSEWRYADPSTKMPFGSALSAVSEVWRDPMDPIGNLPEAGAEIVTMGKPAGVGTILGYATVSDLQQLLNHAAYDLQQIQAAAAACPLGWPDTQAWILWNADLATAQADFDTATKAAHDVITATPHWLAGFNVITYQWGLVTAVIDECRDLDRRWRIAAPTCAAPNYPNEPQPIVADDPDQWIYNDAGTAIKGIETTARNATQPLVIGTVGIGIGIGIAVVGVIALNMLMAPVRR